MSIKKIELRKYIITQLLSCITIDLDLNIIYIQTILYNKYFSFCLYNKNKLIFLKINQKLPILLYYEIIFNKLRLILFFGIILFTNFDKTFMLNFI